MILKKYRDIKNIYNLTRHFKNPNKIMWYALSKENIQELADNQSKQIDEKIFTKETVDNVDLTKENKIEQKSNMDSELVSKAEKNETDIFDDKTLKKTKEINEKQDSEKNDQENSSI